ncbi:MAG TPA: hypothetical protein VHY09_10330, partial [Candidatus Methylacidiphilales bacterium]|nr:hypothetical protein [Candidatus Methylacidiphilales bacterium]
MSRFVLVILGIVVAVVLLVAAAAGVAWWKISALKEQLRAGLAKSLGADVQVASLDIDPWKSELHAAGITLTNQRASQPWEKGDIAQATVRYHFADLFSSPLKVTVEITTWNVVLHSPLREAETPPDSSGAAEAGAEAPHRIQVTELTAHEGTVEMDFSDDRKVTVNGVDFDSTEDGGIWTTQLTAASVQSGTLAVGASSVKIQGDAGKLTFSDLRMQCDPGAITGDGEVATTGQHDAKLSLKGVDVPVTMLVGLAWQPSVSGLAAINLTYTGNDAGGTAAGSVALSHGKFNVLPWLSKVTLMVGLPDISGVEVDKATSDFTWKDGALHLSNIDVRKNDVTRIAGDLDLDAQGNVDGKLKLGLPSAVTAKWPQLQTSVFSTQSDDYNWADVHLTGTPNHLQEDLTPRLVAAGLNQGGDILNQATQKAGDLLNSL